jgi:hypothetical protein
MSVDVKGLVFSRNFLDHFETLDKIKLGVDKFFNHKLKQSIKKENPDDYQHRMNSLFNLSQEESDKFSHPLIEYKGDGLFNIKLSFPSSFRNDGGETRKISLFTNLKEEDNISYAGHIGIDTPEKNIMKEFKSGIWISMEMFGSAPDIIASILTEFGDNTPSYLIRNDCADSFNDSLKNVIKIGNCEENISPVSISEKEYMTIRCDEINNEIKRLKKQSDLSLAVRRKI